ncbi:TOTE conflict system archaeo-eukaryotic primase domain-containing protein [Desulfosarcina alkanivorans]|uniref:TOTE conflict system archaeo-eukaryotic primase domain-containing protein n=1 Tax=Desulfosarcina alkanivorans TaxID=571177 RepID=UPI0012D35905|nr:DEAD/DEAH box helicase family protein [Desulfosarcina alkanivorans]
MEYRDLLKKYNALIDEVERLRKENSSLRAQIDLTKSEQSRYNASRIVTDKKIPDDKSRDRNEFLGVHGTSDSLAKINLFMSLFKGRSDVYAKRWENKNKGTSGYSPVCLNQWQAGVCKKPKISCSKCINKDYAALDEKAIENHLRGKIVVGVYPMRQDETCHFLAVDFDEADWRSDISVFRDVCIELKIPTAVERSRSGNGGHVWFFFETSVSATLARKFGTILLTAAMNKRHEIQFKSYDRLFPSQDTMPKGGLGNLIALPLQKAAREKSNSEFIDEHFQSYADQWAFLSTIQKIPQNRIEEIIFELGADHELGVLKQDDEDGAEKPWETSKAKIELQRDDFPEYIEIVKANMLFIPKAGISQKAMNRLKRLASFKNPMFYKQQAMRLPTYGHPRVISCADETKEYLCLPRGCEPELVFELEELGIEIRLIDRTHKGRKIDVKFNGQLRDEQSLALNRMMQNDTGILSGTTAFGKTIVAIKLIAEKKVNTLILVDKVSLLSQWKDRLSEFLDINEILPEEPKKRGRKKKKCIIGQIGAGKDTSSGIIDIAVMQSLSRKGEVKECVTHYGMIIADECHHASAFTYEQILKTTNAKYIYGLTATPTRKDRHHPILFMHCGPIRYRDNPKMQAENRPFDHYIVPRFTSLRVPFDINEQEVSIQQLYTEIMESDFRNQQIIDDVLNNYHQGRNCIVLSLRTAHVESLAKRLKEKVPDVFSLMGGMGKKATREIFKSIAGIPADRNIILVATGHFIGEGFDEPRLDTLFLAMPISWKGTLQQYAGRLHRLYETKKEVKIYDYVDIQVKILEKMYQRRLNGYASMGYKAKSEELNDTPLDIIFDKDSFLPVFNQDINAAKKEILIVSPFVRKMRTLQMTKHLKMALEKKVRVLIVTRPKEDFKPKDHATIQRTLDLLTDCGAGVVFKSNIHQKFAVMDQKIVWYGSINLLSYGSALESIMRIESANIANELVKSIERA